MGRCLMTGSVYRNTWEARFSEGQKHGCEDASDV
jgi:hypothetical protein